MRAAAQLRVDAITQALQELPVAERESVVAAAPSLQHLATHLLPPAG